MEGEQQSQQSLGDEEAKSEYGTFGLQRVGNKGDPTVSHSHHLPHQHQHQHQQQQHHHHHQQQPHVGLRFMRMLYPSLPPMVSQENRFTCHQNPCSHPVVEACLFFRHEMCGGILMAAGLLMIIAGLLLIETQYSLIVLGHVVGIVGVIIHQGLKNTASCFRFERLSAFSLLHDILSGLAFLLVLVGFIFVFSTNVEKHIKWDLIVLYAGIALETLGIVLYFVLITPTQNAYACHEALNVASRWHVYESRRYSRVPANNTTPGNNAANNAKSTTRSASVKGGGDYGDGSGSGSGSEGEGEMTPSAAESLAVDKEEFEAAGPVEGDEDFDCGRAVCPVTRPNIATRRLELTGAGADTLI